MTIQLALGPWRTRDRKRVEITEQREGVYPWWGTLPALGVLMNWRADGRNSALHESSYDIVAPWDEPDTTPPSISNDPVAPAYLDAAPQASPAYYAGDTSPIDLIEEFGLGFHLGNVVKYVCRAGKKDPDAREDLCKAQWYLNRYLDMLEKAP